MSGSRPSSDRAGDPHVQPYKDKMGRSGRYGGDGTRVSQRHDSAQSLLQETLCTCGGFAPLTKAGCTRVIRGLTILSLESTKGSKVLAKRDSSHRKPESSCGDRVPHHRHGSERVCRGTAASLTYSDPLMPPETSEAQGTCVLDGAGN